MRLGKSECIACKYGRPCPYDGHHPWDTTEEEIENARTGKMGVIDKTPTDWDGENYEGGDRPDRGGGGGGRGGGSKRDKKKRNRDRDRDRDRDGYYDSDW